VEEVEQGRRAQRGIVEHRGHVETHRLGGKVGMVLGIVEQPGALAIAPPGAQARPQVGGMGPVIAAEQFDERAQAAEGGGCAKFASSASRMRSASSASTPPASSVSQSIRNWRLTGVSGNWSGLRPEGTPVRSRS
jgi:hypothetical protein